MYRLSHSFVKREVQYRGRIEYLILILLASQWRFLFDKNTQYRRCIELARKKNDTNGANHDNKLNICSESLKNYSRIHFPAYPCSKGSSPTQRKSFALRSIAAYSTKQIIERFRMKFIFQMQSWQRQNSKFKNVDVGLRFENFNREINILNGIL